MQFKRITVCVALAFAPGAFAEEATEATLPTVEVIGRKIQPLPALTDSALGGTSISRQRASTSDTAKLLDGQPGVSMYGAGGVSSLPVIHGLADDRIRTKVDGMDLISACGNHMNPPLSYIDPANVGSARVFAGIAPVSVGGDSIGGTIEVDSAAPEFAAKGETLLKGRVGAFFRSNGNAKGGNLSATIAGEKLSATYTGSTAQSGDYTAGNNFKYSTATGNNGGTLPLDVVGSSMYKSVNQSLGFALRHENHLVELKLGMQDIPYQGFPNQRMDMTGNDSQQINLRYTGQYQWGALEARTYSERTRHVMQFYDDKRFWYVPNSPASAPCSPIGPTCAAGMPMDTEGRNAGTLVKADILLSEHDILRIGGEIQSYTLNDWWDPAGGGMWPKTFWNINKGERDRAGLFAELEAHWNPQWVSLLGVRREDVTMNTGTVQGYKTTAPTPTMPNAYYAEANAFNALNRERADHNWDVTALARNTPDNTKAFEAGYALKTRSPNLYERYTWSTGGMAMRMINFAGEANGYCGNPDLKPEVAHTLSATADWHDAAQEQWGLKITPYATYIQNYIDAVRCDTANCLASNPANLNPAVTTGFVYLRYANQSARLYGMDVSGNTALAQTSRYGSFTAKGVLAYVQGKNEMTGDNLYNMMPLNAKLAVIQQVGNWTNTIEGQLVDGKEDVSQVRNEVKTSGYGLLNLRSSYEWRQAQFDVGIENVFNKFYNLPLGGAYTGQGTTMSATGVAWGTPVPGMGRSVYAGATYKF